MALRLIVAALLVSVEDYKGMYHLVATVVPFDLTVASPVDSVHVLGLD